MSSTSNTHYALGVQWKVMKNKNPNFERSTFYFWKYVSHHTLQCNREGPPRTCQFLVRSLIANTKIHLNFQLCLGILHTKLSSGTVLLTFSFSSSFPSCDLSRVWHNFVSVVQKCGRCPDLHTALNWGPTVY